MSGLTIAVDIDGTLRNLETQLDKYLEIDHPDKVDDFRAIKDTVYRSLDGLFETQEDLYKWMYEERVFELFGMGGRMHPKIIDDLNIFANTARAQGFEPIIASVQRNKSITATLHWLSRWGCTLKSYAFFDTMQDKIDANFDVYIDDCPEVIEAILKQQEDFNGKRLHPQTGEWIPRAIKIPYDFTKDFDCPSLDIASGKFDDLYDILEVKKILKV